MLNIGSVKDTALIFFYEFYYNRNTKVLYSKLTKPLYD